MKSTTDSIITPGIGAAALDARRRTPLATIGHHARGGPRAAALLAAVTVFLIHPGLATAQDTRAEAIRQEQADKQSTVTPPTLNRGERIINRLEEFGWITGEARGIYPVVDSVYPGGGFAAGLGGRKPLGDDGAFNVLGAYSLNSFWRAQTDVSLPSFASRRGRVSLTAGYLDAPDVKYYGIGMDSGKDAKSFFSYTPWGGGGRLDFDLSQHLTVGGGVNYIDIETGSGATGPSIEARFSPATAPGLELDKFKYINSTAKAVFDWRSRLGYEGSGGLYRVQFDDFYEKDNDQYAYRSVEAEVLQLIPLMRANWVIALRGLTTITDIDGTESVPYFMLPSLGGGKTLRGYPDFRFRDRNRLVMNAELRWTPARFLDMAVFYDTGKVAARKKDLDFENLEDSYGVGMRFIGVKGYAFRVEVAHSREHQARLLVSAGGAF
jgi:Omp85 superfamily domain